MQEPGASYLSFRPKLIDYGITLTQATIPEGGSYLNVASRRMLLEPSVAGAVAKTFAESAQQPVITYLANTIAVGRKETPYSTITAIDFVAESPMGPFKATDGATIAALEDDEIVLNSWAAEDLTASTFERVRYVEIPRAENAAADLQVNLALDAAAP